MSIWASAVAGGPYRVGVIVAAGPGVHDASLWIDLGGAVGTVLAVIVALGLVYRGERRAARFNSRQVIAVTRWAADPHDERFPELVGVELVNASTEAITDVDALIPLPESADAPLVWTWDSSGHVPYLLSGGDIVLGGRLTDPRLTREHQVGWGPWRGPLQVVLTWSDGRGRRWRRVGNLRPKKAHSWLLVTRLRARKLVSRERWRSR